MSLEASGLREGPSTPRGASTQPRPTGALPITPPQPAFSLHLLRRPPTLPLLQRVLRGLHALVIGFGLWLILGVVVLAEVGVGQGLGRADPLIAVQYQHPAQEVYSCRGWRRGSVLHSYPVGSRVPSRPLLTQWAGTPEDALEVLLGHRGQGLDIGPGLGA